MEIEENEPSNEKLEVLTVNIQRGTVPDFEIADIMVDLSMIFRKMGGNGISFKLDGLLMKKEEAI